MTDEQMSRLCVIAFAFFVISIPLLIALGLSLHHVREMATLAAGCMA